MARVLPVPGHPYERSPEIINYHPNPNPLEGENHKRSITKARKITNKNFVLSSFNTFVINEFFDKMKRVHN